MSDPFAVDYRDQIRQSIDIVDLIGNYMPLRRQGSIMVGLCPWHDDSRPSLQVNPNRQSWKCWVCDIGGDIFSFVMKREGIGFREALEMLAERAGVELEPRRGPKPAPGSPDDKKTQYQAMSWAEGQYHNCLLHSTEAQVARRYLADRGISDDSIKKFKLGFSPKQWQWIIDRAGGTAYSPKVLEAVGLTGVSSRSGRPYDRFRGRLMFPIRDLQNRVVGFGGRVLPELAEEKDAKYVNSPESRLFSKSEQLYGMNLARDHVTKSREIVIVEGYTDVLMAHQFGLDRVVAVLGTALNERHLKVLKRFADRIVLVLDGDEAGRRRANEVLTLFLNQQIDLRVCTLPAGADPCDLLLEQGADAFLDMIETAPDALEHRVSVATAAIEDKTNIHASGQAMEEILDTLAADPRSVTTADQSRLIREQQILARVARNFGVPEETLRERMSELRRAKRRTATASEPEGGPPRDETARSADLNWPPQIKELFELLTLKPQLVETAIRAIEPDQIPAGSARDLFMIYLKLDASGDYPDAGRVNTEIEDPHLKNLLVTLDWHSHDRAAHAVADPESRLADLLDQFSRRKDRQELQAVQHGRVEDDEAIEKLQQFLQQERARQGSSAPTDG